VIRRVYEWIRSWGTELPTAKKEPYLLAPPREAQDLKADTIWTYSHQRSMTAEDFRAIVDETVRRKLQEIRLP